MFPRGNITSLVLSDVSVQTSHQVKEKVIAIVEQLENWG